MSGLVSILTPTIKGREWFLTRCRASVAAQTYIDPYGPPRIEHVINDTEGIGPMPAYQLCLDQAHGEFVMPLSDDDWLAPHAVEKLVPFLVDNDVVFARMLIISPGNDRLVDMGCAVMWRKSLSDELGGYDPKYRHAGDSDLYARFIDAGASIAHCPEPLYFFTEHAEHNSYVYRDELAQELSLIHALHPNAIPQMEKLIKSS